MLCVYFNDTKIVSGSGDKTIKVFFSLLSFVVFLGISFIMVK